jgi:hypothetical protein
MDGIKLQKLVRSEYLVIGKGLGGKVSGTVSVNAKQADSAVFYTRNEFFALCVSWVIVGAILGWVFRYLTGPGKKSKLRTLVKELAATSDSKG